MLIHDCVALKAGDREVAGSPRATTAGGGAATASSSATAPSFPAHAELRKVAENLSTLRMRQARNRDGVDLCFLTFFGSAHLDTTLVSVFDAIWVSFGGGGEIEWGMGNW